MIRDAGKFPSVMAAIAVMGLFAIFAGDAPPAVNEAHYWVKAKNFWNPNWLAGDVFADSGKAHATFYAVFGWTTRWMSLESAVWLGRCVGWLLLAVGLVRLAVRTTGRAMDAVAVACLWIAGVHFTNLAGEWVVGGIEAKVPAYALVLLGLSEVVDRHWSKAWVWMGGAAAFHVLTGGWAVLATMIGFWVSEGRGDAPERKRFWSVGLVAGGAMSLAGVIPAAMMSQGDVDGSAASIYVYDRIPHHLLPANFDSHWYLRHSAIFAVAIGTIVVTARQRTGSEMAVRLSRLASVTIGAILIAVVGLLMGILPAWYPELAAKLLRLYWFRFSDAMVPLWVSVYAVAMFRRNSSLSDNQDDSMIPNRADRWAQPLGGLIVVAGLLGFAYASVDAMRDGVPVSVRNRLLGWNAGADRQQQAATFADWRSVCQWAAESTPVDAVFLTPRHQQTFKWYAGRSEVVNWKDVPQDAASLIQWKHRFFDVFPGRLGNVKVTIHYDTLRRYRRQYGADYLIVDRRVVPDRLPLQRAYPRDLSDNPTYHVYELPK